MDTTKVAVFSMAFIVLATFVVGGFGFVTGKSTYAIPYSYSAPKQMAYPTSMCTKVEVEQGPFCYSAGIDACRRLNSGFCFDQCARDVQITCLHSGWNTIGSPVRIPAYTLPQGFEDAFSDPWSCKGFAFEKCSMMTGTYEQFVDCFKRANLPCSEIGRLKI